MRWLHMEQAPVLPPNCPHCRGVPWLGLGGCWGHGPPSVAVPHSRQARGQLRCRLLPRSIPVPGWLLAEQLMGLLCRGSIPNWGKPAWLIQTGLTAV